MTKKRMTAEEFMAQLRGDAEYQARIAEQARQSAEVEEMECELMRTLTAEGYPAGSLRELIGRYAPIPTPLADLLVGLLVSTRHPSMQEGLVRALAAARSPFDVAPLVELFERTNSEMLRWAIANTFAEVRPVALGSWLMRAVLDPKYGKAREMLAVAVARTTSPDQANPVLVELLNDLPGHAALGLAETGTTAEVSALKKAYSRAAGWQREQIGRTLDIIERRRQEHE